MTLNGVMAVYIAIVILNFIFIRYWNRKLSKKSYNLDSERWRKPVLTYAVSVVSLTASVNTSISPNSVAFGAYYAKVVEDTPIHSASEM